MTSHDQETTRIPSRSTGPAPRPQEKPHLLGIAGEHAGRLFPLEGLSEIFIGRGLDCEIALQLDRDVSRRHARISLDGSGRAWLEDLGSLNGTVLNGMDVSRSTLLARGDRIYVGETCILKLDWLTPDEVARWQSATVDGLTECLNRSSFNARLADLVARAAEGEISVSLLLLDVDRFKSVNDQHGHQAGDFVLQRVAATLKRVLGEHPGDPPAYRYGGEEFAVLIPGAGIEEARHVAERIREAIQATPLAYQDLRLAVTISVGVATLEPGSAASDAAEALVRSADEKLYRAKHEGRNRVIA